MKISIKDLNNEHYKLLTSHYCSVSFDKNERTMSIERPWYSWIITFIYIVFRLRPELDKKTTYCFFREIQSTVKREMRTSTIQVGTHLLLLLKMFKDLAPTEENGDYIGKDPKTHLKVTIESDVIKDLEERIKKAFCIS